jgi:hypothetical protein
VIALKKDEFMKLIQDCPIPERFDQELLNNAAAMMRKWGEGLVHVGTDMEHLFKTFGLNNKSDDNELVQKEKAALRCVASKIFKSELRKEDAVGIMQNFNNIREPGFRWLQ